MKTIEIDIYGIVQGVGFRAYIYNKATRLDIKGYVANMPDGSVKIIAQGPEEYLQQLIDYAKTGPRMSQVERVDVKNIETNQIYHYFDIK